MASNDRRIAIRGHEEILRVAVVLTSKPAAQQTACVWYLWVRQAGIDTVNQQLLAWQQQQQSSSVDVNCHLAASSM